MSIDSPRNWKHAELLEKDPADLTWREMALLTEAEDRERQRKALEERDACESPEAVGTYWDGVWALMPEHIRRIRYAGDPG